MPDNSLAGEAVKIASGAGGFGTALVFGRWLINWISGRFDKRAERIDAQDQKVDLEWQKIREALEKRVEGLTREVGALGKRVTTAEATAAALTVRVGQQEFVLRLVITELERVDKDNAVAKQARTLLEQVQPAAYAARTAPTPEEAELLAQIDEVTQ